jgi:hypothetical protein
MNKRELSAGGGGKGFAILIVIVLSLQIAGLGPIKLKAVIKTIPNKHTNSPLMSDFISTSSWNF